MHRRLVVALLATVALAAAADAAHCTAPYAEPAIETNPLGMPGVPTWYVTNDLCQPGCLFSIWLYEESNGFPGLQRGEGTCHGMIEGDTVIY